MSRVQDSCAVYINEAIDTFLPYAGDNVCDQNDDPASGLESSPPLSAVARGAFGSEGIAMRVLDCAIHADASMVQFATHISWPQLRNLLCGHADVGADAEYATRPLRTWKRFSFGALHVFVLWVITRNRNSLVKLHRWRGTTSMWWILFFASSFFIAMPLTTNARLTGYYYHDQTTDCAFSIMRDLPSAVLANRVISVAAPANQAVQAYRALMQTQALNATLEELCGFCEMRIIHTGAAAASNVTLHLMKGIDMEGTDSVIFSLLLPMFAHDSFVKGLFDEMPSSMPDGAAWFSSQQIQRDVEATRVKDDRIAWVSALAVLVVLSAGIYRPGRGVFGSLALAIMCVACLVAGLVATQRITIQAGVLSSPFSPMAFPIVLGNGVDSVLIMLAARDRGHHKWAVRSCPSMIASQLSTMCSFLVGLAFRVEHFYNFFVYAASALFVSCAMQITLFPALIPLLPSKSPKPMSSPTPRAWLYISVGVGSMIVVLLSVVALVWQPVTLSFEMLSNLHEDTVTHRFFSESNTSDMGIMAPILIFAERPDADFRGIDDIVDRLNASVLNNWHAAYMASGAANVSSWLANPAVSLIYGNDMQEGHSIVTLLAPYTPQANSRDDFAQMREMQALSPNGTCITSFERMGGYTIVQTYDQLWILVLASATCASIAGGVVAGRAGMASCLVLLSTFATVLCVMGALQIHAHLMCLAALIILPGIVIDYVIHLFYSSDTLYAVVFSSATTVAGFAPYAWSHTRGVRDFSVVFSFGMVSGLVYALFAVSFMVATRYDAVEVR